MSDKAAPTPRPARPPACGLRRCQKLSPSQLYCLQDPTVSLVKREPPPCGSRDPLRLAEGGTLPYDGARHCPGFSLPCRSLSACSHLTETFMFLSFYNVGSPAQPLLSARHCPVLALCSSLIAASISEKYDCGDLRSDLQRKLPHICSGT